MSIKSMLKLIVIAVLLSMVLSACATQTATQVTVEPAAAVTQELVVTEETMEGPTELHMAAILTVGLDNA